MVIALEWLILIGVCGVGLLAIVLTVTVKYINRSKALAKLNGKKFLVTGACSGIGREICLELAKRGVTVIVSDYGDEAALSKLADEITATYPQIGCYYKVADLSLHDDCRALVQYAQSCGDTDMEASKPSLDGLILAQMYAPKRLFVEYPEDKIQNVIEKCYKTNMFGSMYLCYYALPLISEAAGYVTLISSLSTITSFGKLAMYVPAKVALNHFFRVLRIEYSHLNPPPSFTVTLVGETDTPTMRASRPGAPPSQFMPADVCAQGIVRATALRKTETTLQFKDATIGFLGRFFPSLLHSIVCREHRLRPVDDTPV